MQQLTTVWNALVGLVRPRPRLHLIGSEPITWDVERAGDSWVAVNDDLGLTVESATWAEMVEDIAAVMDSVFRSLWTSGDLERFLRERNIRLLGANIDPHPETEPVFDIPFLPALIAANEGSSAPAYH